MRIRDSLTTGTMSFVTGLAILASAGTAQADLNLSNVPLVVNNRVAPNVFFEIDDSGSMDFEILMKPYWHYCAYDPDARNQRGNDNCGGNDKIRSGDWEARPSRWSNADYIYVFENDDNRYDYGCNNANYSTIEACGDDNFAELDWRVRSAAANVSWFNPDATYNPWSGFDDADFDRARSHPHEDQDGYDETRDLDGFVWFEWIDDRGYAGDRPRRGHNENATNGGNGEVDLWDSHVRYEVDGSRIERKRYEVEIEGDGDLDREVVDSSTIRGGEAREIKQDIANWYQYHRRRAFVAANAVSDVVRTSPGNRYGLSALNSSDSLFIEVPEGISGDFTEHDDALLEALFSHPQRPVGTPLRRALQKVGEYYRGNRRDTDEPIVEACQKNFSVLLTDGYWSGSHPDGIGDVDGDGHSRTLADVARYYYNNDLSSLPDEVPPDDFDQAEYQHMNTFTVAFGVEGYLEDTDDDGWPNPVLAADGDWGNPHIGEGPTTIDDLWHAAWNSKGTYVSAKNPQDVVTGLRDALGAIAARTSAAAALTSNSTSLASDQTIYQATFNSGSWTGRLLALPFESGGVGEPDWDAADQIPAPSDRNIFTIDPDGNSGVEFEFDELTEDQREALDADDRGAERVAYLRGERGSEGQGTNNFRSRSGILGDIVNSDPFFVGSANFGYSQLGDDDEDDSYVDFRSSSTYQNRPDAVYVGANDGMLHAFDADSGRELFAFVPNAAYPNLAELTEQDYSHRFFVDGSPRAGDAYINGRWATILLGSMGYGGRSVFALDVTDPENFDEDDVLWEFTHDELGYTIGQPTIVRLDDGTWAAIFGNGYNSDSHQAKLFVVPLDDPDDWYVIDTDDAGDEEEPNGLASPLAVDTDADAEADAVYAGDLHGRLWKFDLSEGNEPELLFEATDNSGEPQPITTKPEATRNRQGDIVVFFGTGKYLEEGDGIASDDDPGIQSMYAVKDRGTTTLDRDRGMVEQRIIAQGTNADNSTRYRAFSSEPVREDDNGWYLDLVYNDERTSERIVDDFQLRDGRLIFTSIVPESDYCSFGGTSWINEVNAFSGAQISYPVFDVNGDGVVDANDIAELAGWSGNPGGQGVDGLIGRPTIVPEAPQENNVEMKVTQSSSGAVIQIRERASSGSGRQSWRQLR